MTYLVISASNRTNSQSGRIADLLAERLTTLSEPQSAAEVDRLSLDDVQLPIWDESKWRNARVWQDLWGPVSARLAAADGLLMVCPEWGGMAPPQLKNLLLLCEAGELTHKPAVLVGLSASSGGAYVIAELRMSGYKNNQVLWLPDHLIIREAEAFDLKPNGDSRHNRLLERIDYSLRLLVAYADSCRSIRKTLVDQATYPYGM